MCGGVGDRDWKHISYLVPLGVILLHRILFLKKKKSLKILFENKEHSEDSITADFANTRIEINLGGQGEDSVSEVLAVRA